MKLLPRSISRVIQEFSKLPSIGPKTAQRLAFYLLRSKREQSRALGDALLGLKEGIVLCGQCWNLAEENPCAVCADGARDHALICVVEEVMDVLALEKTGEFHGVYHVLHGVLSPIDGVGADDLKIVELVGRVKDAGKREGVREIILATNPSMEGEATAMYIQDALKDFDVKITRLARGLPVGGDLEYADDVTLGQALTHRKEF